MKKLKKKKNTSSLNTEGITSSHIAKLLKTKHKEKNIQSIHRKSAHYTWESHDTNYG